MINIDNFEIADECLSTDVTCQLLENGKDYGVNFTAQNNSVFIACSDYESAEKLFLAFNDNASGVCK